MPKIINDGLIWKLPNERLTYETAERSQNGDSKI
jgi:hypothetical protein